MREITEPIDERDSKVLCLSCDRVGLADRMLTLTPRGVGVVSTLLGIVCGLGPERFVGSKKEKAFGVCLSEYLI